MRRLPLWRSHPLLPEGSEPRATGAGVPLQTLGPGEGCFPSASLPAAGLGRGWARERACAPGHPPALQTASRGDVNMTSCPARLPGRERQKQDFQQLQPRLGLERTPERTGGLGAPTPGTALPWTPHLSQEARKWGCPPNPVLCPWEKPGANTQGLPRAGPRGQASSPAVCQPRPPRGPVHPQERPSSGPSDQGGRLRAVLRHQSWVPIPVDHVVGSTRFPDVKEGRGRLPRQLTGCVESGLEMYGGGSVKEPVLIKPQLYTRQ